MSINNWKSMKNVAASSEKRGRGRNGDEHRARERESELQTGRDTRRESDTPRQQQKYRQS